LTGVRGRGRDRTAAPAGFQQIPAAPLAMREGRGQQPAGDWPGDDVQSQRQRPGHAVGDPGAASAQVAEAVLMPPAGERPLQHLVDDQRRAAQLGDPHQPALPDRVSPLVDDQPHPIALLHGEPALDLLDEKRRRRDGGGVARVTMPFEHLGDRPVDLVGS
jgi:hypothetical protein